MSSIKEFYDKHSLKYGKFEAEALSNKEKFPPLYAIRNRERKLLVKGANKKVFYFATGSGSDVTHLAKLGAKVVTLDYSIEMINRICERLEKEGIDFKLLKTIHHLTNEFIDNFLKIIPKVFLSY